MEEKIIQFKNIVKSYDGEKSVLDNISLDIYENEFVTLLGPSGCGKTTLLRILGGFLTPDSGSVIFEGKDISTLPPYKREVNTVFQSYALFTHLNVFENIAFGLRIKKEPQDVIVQKVKRMLKLVNLEGYEKRKVTDLSGGQQQRIAIARALVNEPKVLLLDEPLAALDTKLRKEMQQELIRIQEEVGITFIFVTHDQEEALTLSDKIVVMDGGKIQQVGTPEEVYNNPANRFVANFIGEINMVEGVMVEDGVVSFEDKKFQCQAEGFAPGEKVDVVLRPNHIDVVPKENGMLKGVVKSHIFKGINHQLVVETRVGTSITISLQLTDDKPVFSQESGEKISASNFLLDLEDVAELSDSTVIALACAEAWDAETDEPISIKEIEYDIKPEIGTYPVTFSTYEGTKITVNAVVKQENRVVSKARGEEIYAMNIFKKVEDVRESMAIDTDLMTWANASAWSLEDGQQVQISQVNYEFDPDTVEAGTYEVTFSTKGYEYKVTTTRPYSEDTEVGLSFYPEDIKILKIEQ